MLTIEKRVLSQEDQTISRTWAWSSGPGGGDDPPTGRDNQAESRRGNESRCRLGDEIRMNKINAEKLNMVLDISHTFVYLLSLILETQMY